MTAVYSRRTKSEQQAKNCVVAQEVVVSPPAGAFWESATLKPVLQSQSDDPSAKTETLALDLPTFAKTSTLDKAVYLLEYSCIG